jgi:hypothetical protein
MPGLVVRTSRRPAEAPPDVEHHRPAGAWRRAVEQDGEAGGRQ